MPLRAFSRRDGEREEAVRQMARSELGDREALRSMLFGADELRLTAGAAWLGRRDIGVVPAAGLEWTPNEDWNVSLILPRPKVARRLASSATSETWLFTAGSIAGGTFDVRRSDGTADELSLREFQASVGVEQTSDQFGRSFVEIGAGFGRELQFERNEEIFDFGPSVVLRVGLTR